MLSESILAAAKPTREVVEINYQKLFSQQLLIYEPLERAGKLLTSKELKIYETKQDIKYSMYKNKVTPFENAQRWTGKNTFHFLLLNDDKVKIF